MYFCKNSYPWRIFQQTQINDIIPLQTYGTVQRQLRLILQHFVQQRRRHMLKIRRIQIIPMRTNQIRTIIPQITSIDLFRHRIKLDTIPHSHLINQKPLANLHQTTQMKLKRYFNDFQRQFIRFQMDFIEIHPRQYTIRHLLIHIAPFQHALLAQHSLTPQIWTGAQYEFVGAHFAIWKFHRYIRVRFRLIQCFDEEKQAWGETLAIGGALRRQSTVFSFGVNVFFVQFRVFFFEQCEVALQFGELGWKMKFWGWL